MAGTAQSGMERSKPVNIHTLHLLKERGVPITALSAYDATFTRMFDQAGVDVILVGDSVGMVLQGCDNTLSVTLDEIIYHCKAVTRTAKRAHVVGDMPFMSFQVSAKDALRNAGRLVKEGGAHAVKIEGGKAMQKTIRRIVGAGIPVMGHVGLRPQSLRSLGGYRVQGRGAESAKAVIDDAVAVAEAGAYAVVLEAIPSSLAEEITQRLPIPTIGIGAGSRCDGQILVGHDALGLIPDFSPKFVKRFAELYNEGVIAIQSYCDEVKSRNFPDPAHAFEDTLVQTERRK